ncbi:hypothetical protein [Leuconostoc mesenteroides]|uniref:hypothetical protein n=1 Tax=Leuconostoc mesenteroides TaxID=1245 RepID=UPI0023620839|nr:hypothetical protein [Leuconostoc mesenteroides]
MKILRLDIYHVVFVNKDKRRLIFKDLDSDKKQTRYLNALEIKNNNNLEIGTKGYLFTYDEEVNKRYIRNRSVFSDNIEDCKEVYELLVKYGKSKTVRCHWKGELPYE